MSKIWRWAWKWRWWILAGLIAAAAVINWWPGIASWLKTQFPGKTKWDYIEKILIPIASPAVIGFGIWFLDKRAKDRENQREETESKNQDVQLFIERVSAIMLQKQVINLAEAAKRLAPNYKDPVVESARHVIRSQTLSILRALSADTARKSAVMRFLIESQIIGSLTVSLAEANLSGAVLNRAILSDADLRGANLRGADLSEAILSDADLRGADLVDAKLFGASLIKAKLFGADLSRAKLSGAMLWEAVLNEAKLIDAKLFRAKLNGAILIQATLSRAKLNESKLINAILFDADISGAELIDADLSGAELIDADLSGANLSGANLSKADLSGAKLKNIKWDEKTLWPERSKCGVAKNIPKVLKKQLGL